MAANEERASWVDSSCEAAFCACYVLMSIIVQGYFLNYNYKDSLPILSPDLSMVL